MYDVGNKIQMQSRVEEALQMDVKSNQMSGQPKKKQILKKFTKSLEKCDSLHKCPHCPKEYENYKCLVRHSNKKHPEEQKLTFKTNSNRDFIICLLKEKKKHRTCVDTTA